LHPRLADAQKLIDAGRVSRRAEGQYLVHSAGSDYRVVLGSDSSTDKCNCLWYTKHRGTRGPCKHVLAARALRASMDGGLAR
jgi:hypothetical protein